MPGDWETVNVNVIATRAQGPNDACARVKGVVGYPSGCHTFQAKRQSAHVHAIHRGCSAYVLEQLSRIRRDPCMASADSNIFLKKQENKSNG
jgi:hypothetical protein